MTKWYVKDLSKITGVSTQTLHHYDRIDLLKPSIRLANGYRVYSEKDLLKLQQIIALKFFGFELSQIKGLLSGSVATLEHFSVQAKLLEQKANMLLEASKTLKGIISDVNDDESIPWETIIKLIEVYHMTQQLEKTWAGKVLTQEELAQYASFEQSLKDRFTENEQKMFEQDWDDIVQQVNSHLKTDPTSEVGITLGKRCMDCVNHLYGKKYVKLRNAIWRKGFKGGHLGSEHNLSLDAVAWLDQAIDAYFRSQIYSILNQIGNQPLAAILNQWEAFLSNISGDEESLRNEVFEYVMQDNNISKEAKNWLRSLSKA